MKLADCLMEAIENQLDLLSIPEHGWDANVNNLLESIRSMEDLNKEMGKDVGFLGCLNAAEVCNWSGYEQAQEMYDGGF